MSTEDDPDRAAAQADNQARADELKAQQEADDAERKAAQDQIAADNQARRDAQTAEQEAEAEKRAEAQAAMKADQDAREELLKEQQAAYQAELEALQKGKDDLAAEEKAKSDDAALVDAQQARQAELEAKQADSGLTDDERAELEELEAALAARSEEVNYGGSDYEFEQLTPLEQLEDDWEEHGLMGVYSDRHLLIDALGSSFFKWFPPQRRFPEVNFNFVVLAGLDFLGEFQSVSGIGFDVPAKTINEGGRHHSPHYLPFDGPGRRSSLQLRWGAVSTTSLYKWIEAVRIGWNFDRTVYVIQLARDGWPTRIMRFAGCWPTAWDGADLDTGGSSWALQSLTLVYDRFNMMTMPFDLGAAKRQWSG